MWLILCSSSDASALWAYQGLKQLGLAPLHWITAESLAHARRWEHRLNSDDSQFKITLADGQKIDSTQIRGVINRLPAPSGWTAQQATPADQVYAQAELQAFYLSWLHALPGVVINRPTPLGLCGPWMHASEWTLRASRAGLRTCVYRQSSQDVEHGMSPFPCRSSSYERSTSRNLISLRGEIFGGAIPADVARACGRLTADVQMEMLGIQLHPELDPGHQNQWTFAGAMPLPDLRVGGAPLLWRLAQILFQGERP